jgi:ADP-ribosyl-[dinitrogen reductase] hydrolase
MGIDTSPADLPPWPHIAERAKAAFLGVAIGDALGATTEFMTPREIRAKFGILKKIVGGGWLRLNAGQVTDDTEMSLCIARAIGEADGWDLSTIAGHFCRWMKGRPVDIGATCARGIRGFMHEGSLEVPPNEWDAGNGAVMRMAPVALVTLGDESRLATWAVQQAHLTHNHPLSDAACITVGRMVQAAMLGAPWKTLQAMADDLVGRYAKFRYHPYPGNSSAYVVDTLHTVLHYFFSTHSFEDCLIGVVNQGGDADTTGAIGGMIAGAFYGMENLPKRWFRRLDPPVRKEVMALAEDLVHRSPLAAEMLPGGDRRQSKR